jgi:hypothetical protein
MLNYLFVLTGIATANILFYDKIHLGPVEIGLYSF